MPIRFVAEISLEKEPIMAKKIVLAVTLGLFALTATACNTVKGAGKDIESVGEAGDEAIN
jgi:entericidin B